MSNAQFLNSFKIFGLSLFLALSGVATAKAAADSVTTPTSPSTRPDENQASNETMLAYLQLQEKIRDATLAIERTRQESQEAVTKQTEELVTRLQLIEQTVGSQRVNEVQ